MEVSIFLAKVFGLYYIIASAAILLKQSLLRESINELINRRVLFMWGFFDLFFGTILISAHSVWTLDYRVLITLFGYLALFKGILKLFAPEKAIELSQKLNNSVALNPIAILLMIIGIYLAMIGFSLGPI